MYALSSTSDAKVKGSCETRKTLILVSVIQKAPYPPSICTHSTAELPTRYFKLHWPYGSVFIFALIIFTLLSMLPLISTKLLFKKIISDEIRISM